MNKGKFTEEILCQKLLEENFTEISDKSDINE